MAITKTAEVSTTNKHLNQEIKVSVEVNVPETVQEAASEDFYQSETAVIDSLQADWVRRSVNAARPLLRDAETEGDWEAIAQSGVDSYSPGRKGGFKKLTEDEISQFDDMDSLMAHLRATGRLA